MGRRISQERRLRIRRQIPPQRCGATSQRSGQPCQQWAIIGARVCAAHGGRAPQVRARADERIALAEALADGVRRQPWEILEDVQHSADVLMRDARQKITDGSMSVEDFDRFVSSLERAHRLTTANVSTGLSERRQRFTEAQADQMHAFVVRVLRRLELSAHQQSLLRPAIQAEVRKIIEGEVIDAK